MKKQALKAVTMLVSIIALAFMTAVVSNAQSRSTKLRARRSSNSKCIEREVFQRDQQDLRDRFAVRECDCARHGHL